MNKPNGQASQADTKPNSQEADSQSKLSPPLVGPKNDTDISANHNQNSDKESTPTNKARLKAKIKEIPTTDRIMAGATIIIAIATTIYTAISIGQWRFMGQQTVATFQQLSTAKASIRIATDTLSDARNSSVEQADRTDKLIKANERISRATIKAANAASESADIAKSALVAGNRAWVKLDGTPEVVSPLHFDNTGQGNVGIRFNLKNIGRSPALKVYVHATCLADISLYMRQHVKDPRELPECKDLRARKWDLVGGTIFVDQPTYLIGNNLLIITKQEIDKRIARLESEGRADPEYVHELVPIIYGCIDYELSEDRSHHQTGFVYSLYRRDSSDRLSHRMIDTRNRSTPIEQLWLDNYFGSGSYAD